MNKEYHYIISGQVQGVNFRRIVKFHAETLGLLGYAKNLPDRTVEVCVIGKEEDADKLINIVKLEPLPIMIKSISKVVKPAKKGHTTFEVY